MNPIQQQSQTQSIKPPDMGKELRIFFSRHNRQNSELDPVVQTVLLVLYCTLLVYKDVISNWSDIYSYVDSLKQKDLTPTNLSIELNTVHDLLQNNTVASTLFDQLRGHYEKQAVDLTNADNETFRAVIKVYKELDLSNNSDLNEISQHLSHVNSLLDKNPNIKIDGEVFYGLMYDSIGSDKYFDLLQEAAVKQKLSFNHYLQAKEVDKIGAVKSVLVEKIKAETNLENLKLLIAIFKLTEDKPTSAKNSVNFGEVLNYLEQFPGLNGKSALDTFIGFGLTEEQARQYINPNIASILAHETKLLIQDVSNDKYKTDILHLFIKILDSLAKSNVTMTPKTIVSIFTFLFDDVQKTVSEATKHVHEKELLNNFESIKRALLLDTDESVSSLRTFIDASIKAKRDQLQVIEVAKATAEKDQASQATADQEKKLKPYIDALKDSKSQLAQAVTIFKLCHVDEAFYKLPVRNNSLSIEPTIERLIGKKLVAVVPPTKDVLEARAVILDSVIKFNEALASDQQDKVGKTEQQNVTTDWSKIIIAIGNYVSTIHNFRMSTDAFESSGSSPTEELASWRDWKLNVLTGIDDFVHEIIAHGQKSDNEDVSSKCDELAALLDGDQHGGMIKHGGAPSAIVPFEAVYDFYIERTQLATKKKTGKAEQTATKGKRELVDDKVLEVFANELGNLEQKTKDKIPILIRLISSILPISSGGGFVIKPNTKEYKDMIAEKFYFMTSDAVTKVKENVKTELLKHDPFKIGDDIQDTDPVLLAKIEEIEEAAGIVDEVTAADDIDIGDGKEPKKKRKQRTNQGNASDGEEVDEDESGSATDEDEDGYTSDDDNNAAQESTQSRIRSTEKHKKPNATRQATDAAKFVARTAVASVMDPQTNMTYNYKPKVAQKLRKNVETFAIQASIVFESIIVEFKTVVDNATKMFDVVEDNRQKAAAKKKLALNLPNSKEDDITVDDASSAANAKIIDSLITTYRKAITKYYRMHMYFAFNKIRPNIKYIHKWHQIVENRKAHAVQMYERYKKHQEALDKLDGHDVVQQQTGGRVKDEANIVEQDFQQTTKLMEYLEYVFKDACFNGKDMTFNNEFTRERQGKTGEIDSLVKFEFSKFKEKSKSMKTMIQEKINSSSSLNTEHQARYKKKLEALVTFDRKMISKFSSLYNVEEFSVMDIVMDSKFIALYVLKVVHYLIFLGSLFLTEKIFTEMYMRKVYAENKDPPNILIMVGILLAIDAGFVLFLITILYLLKYIFESPANDFIISNELIGSFLGDFVIYIIFVGVLAIIVGSVIQNKRYFKYKTEGVRGIRALNEVITGIAGVLVVLPYFIVLG